jgi:membrane-associated phospholipid phosphatase
MSNTRSYRSFWDNPWFSLPVLFFLNAGLLYAYFIPYGEEVLYFNSWRFEPFNSFFSFFTHLGEFYAYVVAALIMLYFNWRNTLWITIYGLLTILFSYFIKDYIGTERPLTWLTEAGVIDHLVRVPGIELASGYTSFPSGHTLSAFGLFGLLAMMTSQRHPKAGIAFAAIAVLVGISRMFLAQHFLADVLGGAVMGLILGDLVWRMSRWKGFRRLNAARI